MKKTIREIFSRYVPSSACAAFADDAADPVVSRSKLVKNRYEIAVHPSRLWDKKTVRQAEAEIAAAYESQYSVRFVTVYDAALIDCAYLADLIADAGTSGLLPGGFFADCEVSSDAFGKGYVVSVPFGAGSIDFLSMRRAESTVSSLIKTEFGIDCPVQIREMEEYVPYSESEEMKGFISDLDSLCAQSLAEYERSGLVTEAEAKEEPAAPEYKRLWSAFDPDAVAVTEDGICSIGRSEFDISSPSFVFGEAEKPDPLSISSVRGAKRDCCFVGTVSGIQCDTRGRNNPNFYLSFGLFDGNASIAVRFQPAPEEEAKANAALFSDGMCAVVFGDVKKDTKSGELFCVPRAVAEAKKLARTDRAPKKRVELHLHSSMSAMDAMTQPGDIVKTAMKWGMNAVAVTDHGNVQAFPDIMIALDKKYKDSGVPEDERFKPIYGMEAYFVNDTASPLEGGFDGGFDAPTVIFDLETTGFSAINNKIIEIGAVKTVNGEVTDRFSSFVDPGIPIPAEITAVTSITDKDVAGAPRISQILPDFMKFIDGCLLVAHNADFDTGFIREACRIEGLPFDNPYLDTVALSRFLNPELSNHKLDTLAEYFSLGDFNHHRAVDDAEMLSLIYARMIEKLRKYDIPDFAAMNAEIAGKSDPKNLKSYHMIILVRDQTGMKNLYRLISESYLKYYYRNPRIPKTSLDRYRDGLIIGSACSAGELFTAILENRPEREIEEIASYYDYLEIQPAGNDAYLIEEDRVDGIEGIRAITKKIVELGEKLGKPVVATSDSHFIDPEDELYRRILRVGQKFKDADRVEPLYLRTTGEMLDEFSWLGEKKAYEVVVENTNLIADMIGRPRPIPKGTYTPRLEGSDEELSEKCWGRARATYGDVLPEVVENRLKTELGSIIKNGFAVLYVIAERLVNFSESEGYLVGSRGSVGSSFTATMGGISEVNPLPPHYYCKKCRFSDFSNIGRAGSGFDLPDAFCPVCGSKLEPDGQDIPFETFLGFKGEKSPDIDLNFSGDVQAKVHKFTEDLFGAENVFKAGTLSTLADKTAFGYVMKYFEGKGVMPPRAEIDRIVSRCMGVKKTTGQHPGGIIVVPRDREVYDFTPVQHPADDPKKDIVTTHYAFSYLHDTILKLDELGHDIPTKYKYLERYSGIPVTDVAMNDRTVYELFESTEPLGIPQLDREDQRTRVLGLKTGTLGIPEMGTSFIQQVLIDAKPKNFADLMQISGLTHGTDVWLGNAQDLIKQGICTISEVVGTRDGIMLDLIRYGVEKSMAFQIMEKVRKNKKGERLPDEMYEAMRAAKVPEWYIGSLQKIKYMFPKAHAAAYVMSAVRLAWYKVHKPVEYYSAMFSVAPDGFDGAAAARGQRAVEAELMRIDKLGKDATAKEQKTASTMQLANECLLRGIRFLQVDLTKSDSKAFLPENGNIRMPFSALSGVGEAAAQSIVEEREKEPFLSVDDLRERAKLNKSVIEVLRSNGALGGLSESDQLSMFDIL